jgi:dihydropteroate synthase
MTLVMGVLNVTPDSFSDGGRWFDHAAAVEHGRLLVAEGADIVDVGGESTRPGASPVAEDEELRRVLPVVRALAGQVRVSIDTRKRAVAEAAVDAGATIVNDVSADLWPVAAESGAGWIGMHLRGDPATMDSFATYDDVVAEVSGFLQQRAAEARRGGVGEIWIDPGIGFAKTAEQNLAILRRLPDLVATGWPVAVGVSRKRFLGPLSSGRGDQPAPVTERDEASLAAAVWAMTQGASLVRVHAVASAVQASRLVGDQAPTDANRPGVPQIRAKAGEGRVR